MDSDSYRPFASILDDLDARLDDARDEDSSLPDFGAARNVPFDYLAVVDELLSEKIRASIDPGAVRYGDAVSIAEYELQAVLDDISIEPDDHRPMEDPPEAVDPASIAAELGLAHADLPGLAAIRRRFAFANHPDRVPSHLRARALQRMQAANMLIDEAMQRLTANTR